MPNQSYPNQRGLTTHKAPTDKENLYTSINLDALHKAMITLSPKAFELWMYFAKNQNNHFFWLSRVDCLSWCNFKATSYQSAFNELIERNYLIKKPRCENKYDFYEIPKEEEIGIEIHKD